MTSKTKTNSAKIREKEGEAPPGPAPATAAQPAHQTKRQTLIERLSTGEGASTAELIAALGWLPHTVRAAITGLRKAGYAVARGTREDGTSVYSIVRSV